MALKKKPVTGMKDILPREMGVPKLCDEHDSKTYGTFGFSSIDSAKSILKIFAVSRAERTRNSFLKF